MWAGQTLRQGVPSSATFESILFREAESNLVARRNFHLASRPLSSPGAGPSTFRVRHDRFARLCGPRTAKDGALRISKRDFSIDSAISTTFDTAQTLLRYPTGLVSDIIHHSPIASSGATIILLAIVVRSLFTFPTTLWQRRQRAKMEMVNPQISKFNEEQAPLLAIKARKAGMDEKGYRAWVVEVVKAERDRLYKLNGIHPRLSQFGPLLFNLSLLLTMSTGVRASVGGIGNTIASESFMWIQHLGEPDMAISLAAGFTSFAIAEITGVGLRRGAELSAAKAGKTGENQLGVVPEATETDKKGQAGSSVTAAPSFTPSRPSPPPSPSRYSSRVQQLQRASREQTALSPQRKRPLPAPTPGAKSRSERAFSSTSSDLHPMMPRVTVKNLPPPVLEDVNPRRSSLPPEVRARIIRKGLVSVMRGAAVILVIMASHMPAGMVLYVWTSLTYTLGQISLFKWLDERKASLRLVDSRP
ncbi:hypothetical protein BD324DRAFT_169118 [Kockovaella imperatae]|uniref:60Kd inner membrane protein-domain-containing protein n=1 Tax=Kockovaella imperatae TaxID=4999 RepID=A0A1Y1UAT1_9TREE|nr:hypothetical protein BD324DRAFT_169118 [Kockovaella imperatae]ORX34185.1 hypothetical protein BD324DRAFT_169118 [Kockovaella imperatae]